MNEQNTQGTKPIISIPDVKQPLESQPIPPLQQKQSNHNVLWKVLVVCMALLIIGMSIFIIHLLQKKSAVPSISSLDTLPTDTLPTRETLQKEIDQTENWNVYTQSDNLFSFKYPQNMSIVGDNEAGVANPWTGNPEDIVTIMDRQTSHPGTDIPFSGFGVSIVDLGTNSLDEYLTNEVSVAKNSPRMFESETYSKLDNPNIEGAYIDYESNIRRYFIKISNQNKVIVFSTASRDPKFLTLMEQILLTIQ
jgi:hypothetical protein